MTKNATTTVTREALTNGKFRFRVNGEVHTKASNRAYEWASLYRTPEGKVVAWLHARQDLAVKGNYQANGISDLTRVGVTEITEYVAEAPAEKPAAEKPAKKAPAKKAAEKTPAKPAKKAVEKPAKTPAWADDAITRHIAQVFAKLPKGTFLKAREVTNTLTKEFPKADERPSDVTVYSRCHGGRLPSGLTGQQKPCGATKN